MKNMSPKTEESYMVASKLLTQKFGDIDICSISFGHARAWRDWLFEWQSNNTVKNNLSCLRMVLKFLKSRGYPVMEYEEIPVPKREKHTIKYLNKMEIDELIFEVGRKRTGYTKQTRLRNEAIVRLLFVSGIRNGELCVLNRDSIKDRQFTVIGKSKQPRIVYIDRGTERSINRYLDARTDSNAAMFTTPISGKRITPATLRRVFEKIRNNNPKFAQVHPHTLRHSFATHMLHQGVDLRYIADFMGHESMDTTRLYTHYENPKLKEVYDKAQSS